MPSCTRLGFFPIESSELSLPKSSSGKSPRFLLLWPRCTCKGLINSLASCEFTTFDFSESPCELPIIARDESTNSLILNSRWRTLGPFFYHGRLLRPSNKNCKSFVVSPDKSTGSAGSAKSNTYRLFNLVESYSGRLIAHFITYSTFGIETSTFLLSLFIWSLTC